MQVSRFLMYAVAALAIAATSNANAQNTNPKTSKNTKAQLALAKTSTSPTAEHRQRSEVRPLEGALSKVMQLNGVSIHLNNATFSNVNLGFMPHNVKAVLPEAIHNGNVEHASVVPVLVEAMKEQQRQIETQQLVIDRLQRQVNALMNATAKPK